MVIHLHLFFSWTLSFLLEIYDQYVFNHHGSIHIPFSLIHRFLCIAMHLPRHFFPQSMLSSPLSADKRALLRGYSCSLHISAHLCTSLPRHDWISPAPLMSYIKIQENQDTLYHNCSLIVALPHALKQSPGRFRLQSYSCQADSANQSPAQQ